MAFNVFLLAFLTIGWTQCTATYLNYEIDSKFCSEPEIKLMDESINTSVIFEPSDEMPNTCAFRITMSSEFDGFIVTFQNLSIFKRLDYNCSNFIELSSSPPTKWCDSSEVQSLVIREPTLDIAYNFESNDSYFSKLLVTPFKNPVNDQKCVSSAPHSCQSSDQMLCISDAFLCDGFDNCPNGSDEKNCPNGFVTSDSKVITQSYDSSLKDVQQLDSALNYSLYNIIDFCNNSFVGEIKLKTGPNEVIYPAILLLSRSDSRKLNKSDCIVRVSVPSTAHWYSPSSGLSVGIDNISLGNKVNTSCDDFIEISDNIKKKSTKWCEGKDNDIGVSFRGNDYIDIVFHAGVDSNSSFELIITAFEAPSFAKWCPSSQELRCNQATSNNECIRKEFVCDGHRNCPSGEDETNCPKPPITTTTSPNTTTTTTTPTTTTAKTTTTTSSPKTTTPSPTPTPSPSSTTPAPKPNSLSPGMIALIVIASIVALVLVIGGIIFVIKKRRNDMGYNALN